MKLYLNCFLFALFSVSSQAGPSNPQPSRVDATSFRESRQAIRTASLKEQIRYLLDREEISDLVTAYAYSVDTRHWDLHAEIFTETFDEASFEVPQPITAKKRVEGLSKYFEKFSATQHLGFPLLIEIDGDTAYVVASLHARHFHENGDPDRNTLLFGQYEYFLQRGDDGWRINRMALVNRTSFKTSAAEKANRTEPKQLKN